jgi:hypothetical protein
MKDAMTLAVNMLGHTITCQDMFIVATSVYVAFTWNMYVISFDQMCSGFVCLKVNICN